VEHVFGTSEAAGNLIVRVIGLVRVKAKVGLRNLAYNLDDTACWLSMSAQGLWRQKDSIGSLEGGQNRRSDWFYKMIDPFLC